MCSFELNSKYCVIGIPLITPHCTLEPNVSTTKAAITVIPNQPDDTNHSGLSYNVANS